MEKYHAYLKSKNKTNIWRKAKQKEYSSLDKILLSLENMNGLTLRNSMTLRLLGLIEKAPADSKYEVALTSAGDALLIHVNKQKLLDEQLLKIYLDSPINDQLHIPVFPLAIIYSLLARLGSLSFHEYALFICWINSHSDEKTAITLIEEYRRADEVMKATYTETLMNKTTELGYQDFRDHISRLFNMFGLSSYIDVDHSETRWSDTLHANSHDSTYMTLIDSLKNLSLSHYMSDDTSVLNLITISSDHLNFIDEISALTVDEQRAITQQIKERNRLPDIADVMPQMIKARFTKVPQQKISRSSPIRRVVKINYDERGKRNRLIGLFGEKLVFKYEYQKFINNGKRNMADRIDHVSLKNDGLGYDILSFFEDGREKHIEVKTVTGKPRNFRFYITQNELDKVVNDPLHQIYIVFNYASHNSEILEIGNLQDLITHGVIKLTPTSYTVDVAVEFEVSSRS